MLHRAISGIFLVSYADKGWTDITEVASETGIPADILMQHLESLNRTLLGYAIEIDADYRDVTHETGMFKGMTTRFWNWKAVRKFKITKL